MNNIEENLHIEDLERRIKELEAEVEALRQSASFDALTLAEALSESAAALNSTLELGEIFDLILKNVGRVVPHDAANIMIIEDGVANVIIRRGYPPLPPKDPPKRRSWIINEIKNLKQMVVTKQPVVIAYTDNHPNWIQLSGSAWVQSYLGAPICVGDEVFGFLNMDSGIPGHFTSEHVVNLEAFLDHVAIALTNARLYSEIRKTVEELEEQNRELDAFNHTVAHDLKNPLSQIVTGADYLNSELGQLPENQIAKLAYLLHEGAQKSVNIINELLLLASVRKSISIDLEPIDMRYIVEPAVHNLMYMFSSYDVTLEQPDEWPIAVGYGPWIEEVWVNYISNAIKYGGDPPHVKLGADVQPDGMVRFWVRDNGAGIAPEDQAKLFREFSRLDETHAEGHGLGLSIVYRIIKRLGGTVGVESTLGEGSLFYFTLPPA